jgi:glutamate synthase domain-containing protein 3
MVGQVEKLNHQYKTIDFYKSHYPYPILHKIPVRKNSLYNTTKQEHHLEALDFKIIEYGASALFLKYILDFKITNENRSVGGDFLSNEISSTVHKEAQRSMKINFEGSAGQSFELPLRLEGLTTYRYWKYNDYIGKEPIRLN